MTSLPSGAAQKEIEMSRQIKADCSDECVRARANFKVKSMANGRYALIVRTSHCSKKKGNNAIVRTITFGTRKEAELFGAKMARTGVRAE